MDRVIAELCRIDWNDIDEVERACRAALDELAGQPSLLRDRLLDLANRPELMQLCEHYDILDKIVLASADDPGVRVRLHVFLPGYFDRPHNHRWSYASKILRGHYRHYLFGNAELDEQVEPRKLPVLHVREEPVGTSYALHHSMVHAVVAEPFTVSLVVRGPAVKDKFLVMDRHTDHAWWQFGAKDEPEEQAKAKQMSRTRFAEVSGWLKEWNLI
ncbi:hypothetical protein [Nocardia africana]|uniref:Cysteine dioxygenase type I n=1 Tax=Nocardia africana TaxID=134964 RepID=A0A378WZ29_9NOCA|nr:hypothetical protein [Nocardia africana]MCC3312248.1 hypothetical protein [Nocardia africana]SUA46449.1 Uncharacterised protein [Nocardia africana]